MIKQELWMYMQEMLHLAQSFGPETHPIPNFLKDKIWGYYQKKKTSFLDIRTRRALPISQDNNGKKKKILMHANRSLRKQEFKKHTG